jgi:CheY-like chemotaxis protein
MKRTYTPTKPKKILIVDDDEVVANSYQNKLQRERFSVAIARSGEEALQNLAREPVDLIILDFSLPGMNGVEILKTFRSKFDGQVLPIIVFTNFYFPDAVRAASAAGATQCLRKSDCTPRQMVENVRELLGASQTITANARIGLVPPSFETPTASELQNEAKLISDFLAGARRKLGGIRLGHQALMNNQREPVSLTELGRMCELSRLLAGAAGVAGFREIARLADALGSLFIRLSERPATFTASVDRTIGQAIDLLGAIFNHAPKPTGGGPVLPQILVVDDEIISREAICSAIERAGLRSVSVSDSIVAQGILEKTHFDLIFLDVEMPGQSGLELCSQIRKMATNRTTPVVFVTAHSDFERRARSVLSGGNDFIAKPFLPIELAVKTLILLFKGDEQPLSIPDLKSSLNKSVEQRPGSELPAAHVQSACANGKDHTLADPIGKS